MNISYCKVCGKEIIPNEFETCDECHKKILQRLERKNNYIEPNTKTLYFTNKSQSSYKVYIDNAFLGELNGLAEKKFNIKFNKDNTKNQLILKKFFITEKTICDFSQSNIFVIEIYDITNVKIIPISTNVNNSSIANNFIESTTVKNYLYIDEYHKYICIPKISQLSGKFIRNESKFIKYSDIKSVEMQSNEEVISSKASTKGGLGSAVVGGALFGPVGAIVGASTGKKNTQVSYNNNVKHIIRILLNDINHPCETIIVDSDSISANKILSVLELIINNNNNNSEKNNSVNMNHSNDDTDKFEEIKKFKELLEQNIITQEDFEKKKKELLKL